MNDEIWAPQSRWGDVPISQVKEKPDLRLVATSDASGWQMLVGKDARDIYLQGHPEYYPLDLAGEYKRDKGKGLNPLLPDSYFPDDDDTKDPICSWRSDGHILYRNWVEFLYNAKRRNAVPRPTSTQRKWHDSSFHQSTTWQVIRASDEVVGQ